MFSKDVPVVILDVHEAWLMFTSRALWLDKPWMTARGIWLTVRIARYN